MFRLSFMDIGQQNHFQKKLVATVIYRNIHLVKEI